MNKEKGLIRTIVLIIIGLVILKFVFDFDIVAYLESDEFRNFWLKSWGGIKTGWDYLLGLVNIMLGKIKAMLP